MTGAKVKLNNIRIAPRKLRLLADLLRGLPVNVAEAELSLRPQRGAGPLLKLIRSAVANVTTDGKVEGDSLFIKAIKVDEGQFLKRSLPRARGMATMILKKSSHVTLELGEDKNLKRQFNIVVTKKTKERSDSQKPKAVKPAKPEPENKSAEPVRSKESKPGVLKKMFRRKSV